MLVLTRRENERLHLGKDIIITVVKVKGNRAVLSIKCPNELAVQRGESRDYFVDLYQTEDICYGLKNHGNNCGICIKCKFEEHLESKNQ